MKPRILVVTPALGFGELIRQTLEDTGLFSLAVASSREAALQLATKGTVSLAILDSDLPDVVLEDFVGQLKENSQEMRLLVIPPEEAAPDYLGKLLPDGYLSKPFYLPDLPEMIQKILGVKILENSNQPDAKQNKHVDGETRKDGVSGKLSQRGSRKSSHVSVDHVPVWFQDAGQVHTSLTRLIPETSAYAAFVLRYAQVWAFAGEIREPELNLLAGMLTNQWSQGKETDLARFVHLAESSGECMLYATHLGGEYVLGMLFNAEVPFSMIRKQANGLSTNLRLFSPAGNPMVLADTSDEPVME
jgi:CheY-like chemotaxis protein